MNDISQWELRKDSGAITRFIGRDLLVDLVFDAPRIDYYRFREDVDSYVEQDANPRV